MVVSDVFLGPIETNLQLAQDLSELLVESSALTRESCPSLNYKKQAENNFHGEIIF